MSAATGDPRQRLALRGEAAAARALERRGMAILERRFRCRLGELDLVARDGDTVVFVEVKTRRDTARGRPAEAVTARKRLRLSRAARWWLVCRRAGEPPCRFDVVEVIERRGELSVRHLRDAFRITPTG